MNCVVHGVAESNTTEWLSLLWHKQQKYVTEVKNFWREISHAFSWNENFPLCPFMFSLLSFCAVLFYLVPLSRFLLVIFGSFFVSCLKWSWILSVSPIRNQRFPLSFQIYPGFPHSSVGKEPTCNAGDPGSIPGLGRSAGEGIGYPLQYSLASLVAQLVKNTPAVQETPVRSLGWEDPLEKGKATYSSISGLENSMDCIV